MSLYDARRIDKPRYLKLGPLNTGRYDRAVHVMAFDTEAIGGRPVLLQVSAGGGWADAELFDLDDRPHACLRALMRWITRTCTSRKTEYLLFGMNLAYEWTQLFGDIPDRAILGAREFDLTVELDEQRWHLDVTNFRRHYMTILRDDRHVRIKVLDVGSFYPGGLAAIAKMVGVEDKDEISKDFLANLTPERVRDPLFRKYAAQDAVTTRLAGERVLEMHETFDVQTCWTAPQLASRVFRRHFLDAVIPLPGEELEQAGLLSYHGGKNGYYHSGPVEADAWSLDIVSAYPQAMRALPTIEAGEWVSTRQYRPGLDALWLVRTDNKRCRYGGLFGHDGRRLPRGEHTVWTTSYELDMALAHDETNHYEVLDGFVLNAPSGEGSALTRFVDRFFAQKRTSTGSERATAKLMLNSLYGKFFQKVPVGDVEDVVAVMGPTGSLDIVTPQTDLTLPYDYTAGGLYHPPIASLITGFVRARVHGLEHEYRAHATSTDGLFAEREPPRQEIGDQLGMLTADHGRLRIWRERLYAFGQPSGPVEKYALHGWRAGIRELQEIPLESGVYAYQARHPMSLRESTLREGRYRPGEFALLDFKLTLGEVAK